MADAEGSHQALGRAVIFLGPPGAGKGTQAVEVARQYRIKHLSTGDMLRDMIARKTPLGLEVEPILKSGRLVPDEKVLQIVEHSITQDDCKHGFVLDGFPRTLPQAVGLDEILRRCGWERPLVVNFVLDPKLLMRRLTGRRICKLCGEVYNVFERPPKVAGRCDADGGELVQRPDDREEVIAQRLKTYEAQTRPLEEYYRGRGALVDLDGAAKPAEVAAQLSRILRAW